MSCFPAKISASLFCFGVGLFLLPISVFAVWTPVEKSPLEPLSASEWNELSHNASSWERTGGIDAPGTNVFLNTSGGVGIGTAFLTPDVLLDVEGKIAAQEYCDENGQNCVAGSNLGVIAGGGGTIGVISGGGLVISESDVGIITAGCASGDIMKFDGTEWDCSPESGGVAAETDPTVPDMIKDGIDWAEISGIPADFADDTDAYNDLFDTEVEIDAAVANNGYLIGFTETDPTVNELAKTSLACDSDEIAKYNGTDWICAADENDGKWIDGVGGIEYDSGNVSISNGADTTIILETGSGSDSFFTFSAGGVNKWSFIYDGANTESLLIYDDEGSTVPFLIDKVGNIGIGTISPTETLDVNGNITASGKIFSTPTLAADPGSTVVTKDYVDTQILGSSTDDQTLSLAGNTLTLEDGGGVDLSSYLDNTDAQDLSLSGNILSLTGDGTVVDLSVFARNDSTDVSLNDWVLDEDDMISDDDTKVPTQQSVKAYVDNQVVATSSDDQLLDITNDILSIEDGNSVDLSQYKDYVDIFINNLTWKLPVNVPGGPVDDDLGDIICESSSEGWTSYNRNDNIIYVCNGTSWVEMSYAVGIPPLSGDITGDITTNTIKNDVIQEDHLSVTNSPALGYLLSYDNEGSFTWLDPSSISGTDDQSISLTDDILTLENGGIVDLGGYLDNTDSQDLILTGNILSLTGDASLVDLSAFLDNTDSQSLIDILEVNTDAGGNIISNIGAPTNPGDAATKGYVDVQILGSSTDDQLLNLTGNTLSIEDGNSVDLNGYLDNTDEQILTLSGNSLSIENGNNVDLSALVTIETNDLSSAVTWANVPNENITEASVAQHQGALIITESQISDFGDYLLDITGESLTDLSDVLTNMTPDDGQVLTYDTTNGWQAENTSSGVTNHGDLDAGSLTEDDHTQYALLTGRSGDILNIDQIEAIDTTGLGLYDASGNGIFIEDGGNIGIGIPSPPTLFSLGSTDYTWTGSGFSFGDGDTGFYEGADDILRVRTNETDALFVDADGNMKIGISGGSQIRDKLTVIGSFFAGGENAGIRINGASITSEYGPDTVGSLNVPLSISSKGNSDLNLSAGTISGNVNISGGPNGGSVIIESGRFGLGTTSPEKLLHLKTTIGTNAEINIQSGEENKWGIYQDEITSDLRFWNIGPDNLLSLTNEGNIGIRTTAPNGTLDVQGGAAYLPAPTTEPNTVDMAASQWSLWFDEANDEVELIGKESNGSTILRKTLGGGGGDFADGGDDTTTDRILGNNTAHALNFETNDVTRMSIAATGVVSIDNLQVGSQFFEPNAGVINWIDMPVSNTPNTGTVQSYSAQIDSAPLLTLYAEADGNGGIQNKKVKIHDLLQLSPTDSPETCNSANAASIYFDTSMNIPCYCNGTSWVQFDGSTNCG